jgi:hypothetical protein
MSNDLQQPSELRDVPSRTVGLAAPIGTPKDFEDMLVAVLRNTIHAIGINATCKLLASTIQGMGYAKHLRRFS